MKIKVWTFTSDTDDGMQTGVFNTQREAYEEFKDRMMGDSDPDDKDRAESLFSAAVQTDDYSDLDEFLQDQRDMLDSCSVEEHEVEVAAPFVLVTVSGGVADVAVNADGIDVDILDYDNVKATLGSGEGLILSDQELAYIREHDTPAFVAEVEAELAAAEEEDQPDEDEESHPDTDSLEDRGLTLGSYES